MQNKKLKTYVLTISRTFPAYHPHRGEETYFVDKIENALTSNVDAVQIYDPPYKLHTIRGNLALWQKRIAEVQAGEAVLSLRYLEGTPRKKGSKQVEFARLTAEDGVGVQELIFWRGNVISSYVDKCRHNYEEIAEKDGLHPSDFRSWFEKGGYDLSQPMALIYLTKFRY